MTRPDFFVAVATGDLPRGAILDDAIALAASHIHAIALGRYGRGRCSWAAYSTIVDPSIEGDREAFRLALVYVGLDDDAIAGELKTWDRCQRPLAIVHAQAVRPGDPVVAKVDTMELVMRIPTRQLDA